jgi:hypothetical protein
MASQEELENARKLREELGEILFLQRSLADEALKAAKTLFASSTQARATSRAFRGIANISREINSQLEDLLSGEKTYNDLIKSRNKLKQEENFLNVELGQALAAARDNSGKLVFNEEQINEVLEGRLGVLDLVAQAEREVNNSALDLLALYDEQLKSLKGQEKELNDIETSVKNIQKGTGLTGTIFEGIEEVSDKLGGSKFTKALGLDEAIKKGRVLSATLTGGGSKATSLGDKAKIAGKMFEVVGKNLLKALGPITLIVELVQGIMQADKETTELKKSMALNTAEAMSFRTELALAAAETGDVNITSSKLLKTFSDLNKQFGFITNFATDTLVTMTKLVNVVGVSSESAGNLAAASSLTGRSFEANYKDALAISYELQRQSGVQMDLREILDQTGKITGTVRANLGANPALIAKAITQAKLFGASLEQVAAAGKTLLDFESSITAELEAELLLGRDINLERARAAALSGDQVALAQELQKQAGDFSTFTKMNVIQQEALAKAMGMSSDQLADILFQQEIQGKNAKELRALGKNELADRVEAQTLADKFNATVDKLKGIFSDVGTAFMPVLQGFGAALSLVGAIVGLLGDLINLFRGDFDFSGLTNGLKGVAGSLGFSTADDVIMPAGYGDTIIKKGKDTIALNNDDTVVAGTNLMGSTQNTPISDNTETKRTNQLLERLINQPAVFKIGTDEFYTATSKYSYQIQ